MRSYDTIIVGGGAAGMAAAFELSRKKQNILLIDRLDRIGKKILVTGNGRCNLTNLDQKSAHYRSSNPEKAWEILSSVPMEDTFAFFQALGIYTKDKDGYVYPYNEQALSVREAFEEYLANQPGLDIRLETDVQSIKLTGDGKFKVKAGNENVISSYLVIATGGLAGVKLGCDGSGYEFAKKFGHKIEPVYPALTALKSKAPFLKKLSGVRNTAGISLYIDEKLRQTETGELQWTDYGISGVAIFQISRFAVAALERGENVRLVLDMLPDLSKDALKSLLRSYVSQCTYKSATEILKGIFPSKLAPVLLREARIGENPALWSGEDYEKLIRAIKEFTLRISGYMGYEKAQTTCGGVRLCELTQNLESIRVPGLYFAGEVVDVDGTCGGYNLQWAWTSGRIAGRAINEKGKFQ